MYNRVIMIGRLVADPEMRTTQNGTSVVSARIAVDRPRSKDGDKKSDFFNVVAWRQNAEFISRYFSKGKLIGIEGSLQTREYTDKEGNQRTVFEIVADRAFFVEAKGSAAADVSTKGVSTVGGAGEFTAVDDDSDLPF